MMFTAKTLSVLPRSQKNAPIGAENLPLDELNLSVGDILILYDEQGVQQQAPVAWFSNELVWAFYRGQPVCFSSGASCKESGIVQILRPAVAGDVALVEVLVQDF